MIAATIDLEEAGRRCWDAVIVGAGPAGSVAARELARRGRAVLLVDKATFPRHKVCGCCLNLAALSALEHVDLGELPALCGAFPLRRIRIATHGREVTLPLPGGVSLSRQSLDAALVRSAQEAGAMFLPGIQATPGDTVADLRCVRLHQGQRKVSVFARLVLAANGLAGNLSGSPSAVQAGSRIGAGTVADSGPAFYTPGTIFMAYGAVGYVGAVRLEDGRLDVAAALDRAATRAVGGLGAAVESILADAGFPAVFGLRDLPWRGTPLLTRRSTCIAAHRLFALGDAAGYVEPFTGEGIGWALASAVAVTPLALKAVEHWSDDLIAEWEIVYHARVARRQRLCQAVTAVLRRPALSRGIIAIMSWLPALASPVLSLLNAPPQWEACRS